MTKEFRRLLMHKSSISVWKATLESVQGLPPCPPAMSEPQWVNLVFDPHCHASIYNIHTATHDLIIDITIVLFYEWRSGG